MRRSLTWLGLVGLLTLLLAACGGDDSLSDEAYFQALADVGAESDARLEPLYAPFAGDESGAAFLRGGEEAAVTFLDGLQAVMAEARDAVAALAAPSDLTAANDAFVEAADAMIAEIDRARLRVEAGDLESVFEEVEPAAFDEFRRACARLQQLALDRGFDPKLSCAEE
ncbi:MAG: hypothetical protein O6913_03225 [Chloroflexi bacterium]|nr:hypothetical protein [Chloroflexota bacterium]